MYLFTIQVNFQLQNSVRGWEGKGGGYKSGVIKTPIELGKALCSTLTLDQKQEWGIRYKVQAKIIFLWNFVPSPKPANSGGRGRGQGFFKSGEEKLEKTKSRRQNILDFSKNMKRFKTNRQQRDVFINYEKSS